ncbi:nucleoside triphosphate pyrophosphohydrolase [Pasteurella multocida subsp. multocida str. Anand1_buffalo]|nr:nucleoside triphosphate pyrophosphohydrolase [Pasteurella multocida subsp. multocida str. Anand1_buffalo]
MSNASAPLENKLKAHHKTLEQSSLMEMDLLWDEVKRERKNKVL